MNNSPTKYQDRIMNKQTTKSDNVYSSNCFADTNKYLKEIKGGTLQD